jgi:hypothetical protein
MPGMTFDHARLCRERPPLRFERMPFIPRLESLGFSGIAYKLINSLVLISAKFKNISVILRFNLGTNPPGKDQEEHVKIFPPSPAISSTYFFTAFTKLSTSPSVAKPFSLIFCLIRSATASVWAGANFIPIFSAFFSMESVEVVLPK